MHFLIFVLIICFFIFLFSLYFLTNDDLIIIRKDMPMDKVFNAAFLTAFVALFFARFFYVIFYPKEVFLSPLGFLLFPYFPGLSLLGGVLGGSVFLAVYAKNQRLPVARMLDFFAVAFLSSLSIGFFGVFVLTGKSYFPVFIFSFLAYLILFVVFTKVFLPASFRGKIKNGSIGIMFLMFFSVIAFISRIIGGSNFFAPESAVLLGLFLVSAAILLREEVIGKRVRK